MLKPDRMERLMTKWRRQRELQEQRIEDGYICSLCHEWERGLPLNIGSETRPFIIAECDKCVAKMADQQW